MYKVSIKNHTHESIIIYKDWCRNTLGPGVYYEYNTDGVKKRHNRWMLTSRWVVKPNEYVYEPYIIAYFEKEEYISWFLMKWLT